MSPTTASICASIISAGTGVDRADPERVLRGDRGDRGHRVAAEHGDRLDVGLDARAAARVRAGDDEDAGGSNAGHAAATASQMSSTSRSTMRGVVALGHHPDQRLGARLADDQPAVALELGLGRGDRAP